MLVRNSESVDILVVEDDYAVREGLAELLMEHGFEVARAGDGADALARMRASPPAVLLLDLTMPVMSGWQLCRELARDPALAGIPVILMSGGSGRVPPRPPGLVAFLKKPLDLPLLIETVRGRVPTGTPIAEPAPRRASCS